MTYNPSLAKVKVNYHTKNKGHRSNGSAVRLLTHTHTHTQKHGFDSITSTADAGGNEYRKSLGLIDPKGGAPILSCHDVTSSMMMMMLFMVCESLILKYMIGNHAGHSQVLIIENDGPGIDREIDR